MNQKPSELLLSVIDFFGILIPGAILALLHGNFILHPLGLSLDMPQSIVDWIPAFFISFILGHFLLGFSVPFNQLAARFPSKETEEYEQAVLNELRLPLEVKSRTNLFYSAFSFIRISNPGATVELERQSAEYKLFRSLTLLFLLDIPLSMISHSFTGTRLVTDLLIIGLSAYRFRYLFDWTYQLVFVFYLHLQNIAKQTKSDEHKASEWLHSTPPAVG